jgi:cytoskeletal protein RodZ
MSAGKSGAAGWIAAILVLGSAGLAGWAWQQRRQAQTEVAELTRTQADLASDLKRARERIDRQNRAAAASADAARTTAAAAVKAPAKPDIGALISSHPQLLATYVKALRGYLQQRYGPLWAQLHLSDEQIDRLETLIVNQIEGQLDLNSTAQAQGLAGDDPAIAKEREQQKADLEAAEKDLLGPDAYQAFDATTRADAVRGTVEQVAYMTQFSAAPLSGDQSNQLVQLLAQSSSDYRAGKDASTKTVDWDAVLAQAPSFLAPSQVATLQGVAQEARFETLVKEYSARQTAAK